MVILARELTTGQITFVLRVVIHLLSFLGIFLLGLIVLGNAPRIAPLETHDILNRFVGNSTTTLSGLKWISKRIFRKSRDPISAFPLVVALALSLSYGLFVTISDLGLIGIRVCSVPGPSYEDFPASIKSDSDALDIVSLNMLNGTDPHTIISYRCDASHDVKSNQNFTICTAWHNSTYGDGSTFRNLNSTDSDILMPKNLARDSYYSSSDGNTSVNTYFLGPSGATVMQPMIQNGIAILPHDIGVRMIVNVPQLSKQQKVNIPKTLALEVEIGCMSTGTRGARDPDTIGTDYFVEDSIYLRDRQYIGPDSLHDPLAKAADAVRASIRQFYSTSDPLLNAIYPSYYVTAGEFSWQTQVTAWDLASYYNGALSPDIANSILGNCTLEIHHMLNVSFPSKSQTRNLSPPNACGFNQISGSSYSNQSVLMGHAEMVCATTTQVNMVSATLEVDGDDVLNATFTRLPSDLNIVQASFFNTDFISTLLRRFTLSDNPTGATQHYIYQVFSAPASFSPGAGSIGEAFSQVGSAMISFSYYPASLGLINPNYFSANYSTGQATKWGGGLGASYLLSSVGYNGWVARGSQAFTVISTGGQSATCLGGWYAVAFLPLLLAAIGVMCWAAIMLFTARIKKARRLQKLYGGLSPVVDPPFPGKLPPHTWLEWGNDAEPHLKPPVEKTSGDDTESEVLVSNSETDEVN